MGRRPDVGGCRGGPVRVRGLVRAAAPSARVPAGAQRRGPAAGGAGAVTAPRPAGAGTAAPARADQAARDSVDRYRDRAAAGRVHPAPVPEREAARPDHDRRRAGQVARPAAGVQPAAAEPAGPQRAGRAAGGAGAVTEPRPAAGGAGAVTAPRPAGTAAPARADQAARDSVDRYRDRAAAGRVHPAPVPEREAARPDHDRRRAGHGARPAVGVQPAAAEPAGPQRAGRAAGGAGAVTEPRPAAGGAGAVTAPRPAGTAAPARADQAARD